MTDPACGCSKVRIAEDWTLVGGLFAAGVTALAILFGGAM